MKVNPEFPFKDEDEKKRLIDAAKKKYASEKKRLKGKKIDWDAYVDSFLEMMGKPSKKMIEEMNKLAETRGKSLQRKKG